MAKVFKISKKTYNAITETDGRNLVLDSTKNHLKTRKSGSFTKSVAAFGTTDSQAVLHNSSSRPLVLAYWRLTSSSNWLIVGGCITPTTSFSRYSESNVGVDFYVDDTSVVFKLYNSTASSKEFEVKYEIFYEAE